MASKRKPAKAESWAACKRVLKHWPHPGVVALVQELYRLSDENRRFLNARLLPATVTHGSAATEATKVVRRMLTPSAVFNGRFRHADIKRVIDQLEKATGDPAIVAEVLLADLDAALLTFSQVGDYEPIVDHCYAMMKRLEDCLAKIECSVAAPLVQKLVSIADRWGAEFGYGLSDELLYMASDWRERVGLD